MTILNKCEESMDVHRDGAEVEGGITIWGMAEERLGKLTPKQLGEIAEAEFIAKAVSLTILL
jgi:hypothetical protein